MISDTINDTISDTIKDRLSKVILILFDSPGLKTNELAEKLGVSEITSKEICRKCGH
jgi:Mn-dependent DtxR family transcriptional regulator